MMLSRALTGSSLPRPILVGIHRMWHVAAPFPRLFHTSSISFALEPDTTSEHVKSTKDAARPRADTSTVDDLDVDPTEHPIEAIKRTFKQIRTRRANPTHESVVNLIKKDHANIDRLYDVYQNVTDADSKLLMGEMIIREICIHSNAEEIAVYSEIDQKMNPDKTEKARNDHASIESALKKIDRKMKWDETYDKWMNTAIQNFRAHSAYEESELLTLLSESEARERLIQLGDSFEIAKIDVPTRPHPKAPRKGILGAAAKMTAKTLDDMRDTIRFTDREPDIERIRIRLETNPPPP